MQRLSFGPLVPLHLSRWRIVIAETRHSLLLQIRDRTQSQAWDEFVEIYHPLIYRIARQQGLQDADAQDVTQRVLVTISNKVVDWKIDQRRGSFRRWLNRVARNAVVDCFRRQKGDPPVGGSAVVSILNDQPDRHEVLQEAVEREHRRSVFRWAARRVRGEFHDSTWHAFWLTTVEDQRVAETAAHLNLSPGAVYTARSRIMKRLKEVAASYEAD